MISMETMQTIANMDLTELKKKSPAYIDEQVMNDLQEYDNCLTKLKKIVPAYENIKEYGMTNSICDTYKDTLWEQAEFDIEPFRNAPYAQLEICIEGLGAVIRKIYVTLRNLVWRLKDFFTIEAVTARWFSACEAHRITVDDLLKKIIANRPRFDSRKFMGKSIRSMDFNVWTEKKNALIVLVNTLKNIAANADQVTTWNSFNQNNKGNLAVLHASTNGKTINVLPVNDILMGTTDQLHWRYDTVYGNIEGLRNLLKNAVDIKIKMNMFNRMLVMSERNISDVLTGKKEPEVVRDENTIHCIRMFARVCDLVYNNIKNLSASYEVVARTYLECCTEPMPENPTV